MKRAGRIISLIVLLIVCATSLSFAEGLELQDTYPKDGATGTSIENLGVKLYFNHNITEKVAKANEDKFSLEGPNGEEWPIRVLYPEKEEGVIMVLLDNTKEVDVDGDDKPDTVQGNSAYTLHISGALVDDDGNTLGQDRTISFTTTNQRAAMTINMVLMLVMFGSMMFFSTRQAKKMAQEQAAARQRERDEKVNPYKEAKRTGKSVEEIVEKDQKDKAKRAAKEAAREARMGEDAYEWIDENTYRVARRRPISEGGSTYITGRKAAHEAKVAEEAARKAKIAAAKKKQAKKGKGKKKK